MLRRIAADQVTEAGLRLGTYPENVAALRLHRWRVPFVQQHPVGRYRLDFAVPKVKIAIEVDGPHHLRPDVAHRDALRDAWLRERGWVILRVTAGDDEQLSIAARLINLAVAHP